MFAKMFVVFAVTTISVVTANPLFQAIASQSCPICEKTALRNQLQNLFLQAANNFQPYPPICKNQNPVQVKPALPSKRSCPVHPQAVQNQFFQVPTYQQPPVNQPYCPYTSQNIQQSNPIFSEAMNKILSNPSLKSILDPSTKLFNQNGLEIPRNGPCNSGLPQVVNNYIIVPPEFLIDDKKSTAEDKKPPKERRKKNKNTNVSETRTFKHKNTVRENQERRTANAEAPFAYDNTRINERIPVNGERNQIRRKKPEIKVNVISNNAISKPQVSDTIVVTIDDLKRQSEKEIVSTSTTTENQINAEQNTAPLPSTQEESGNKTDTPCVEELPKEKVKTNQNSKTTGALKIEVQNPTDAVKPKGTHTQSNNSSNKRAASNSSKLAKVKVIPPKNYNPREQAVINDFKRKFPYIPEDVVVNLLNHMKQQLMSQNIGYPPFYYPQMPMSFDQLHGNRFAPLPPMPENGKKLNTARKSSNREQTSTNRRKSNTRRRKPKKSTTPEPCNTVIELTPTVEVTTKVGNVIETTTLATRTTTERPIIEKTVPTTTTERPIIAEIVPPTTTEMPIIPEIITTTITEVPIIAEIITEPVNDESTTESKDNLIETTTHMTSVEPISTEKPYIKEIKKEVILPELGSEDVVPTIYLNELYDEYYPDFTGDLQYYSDEDIQYFGLEDDRYHYTTDKNFPLEELNRERRRLNIHANNANPHLRRPQDRHIFRIRNWESAGPNGKPMNHRRRPKFRSLPRPRPEKNNVTPKIKVLVKENQGLKPDSVKTNTERPKSDEIQFRTPPKLEFIDFETKPINKQICFHDDYKTSSYSDIKTPQYHFEKNSEKTTKLNHKQKTEEQIQTHLAGSKVAIYGTPVFRDLDVEKDQFENEDKVIVVAKSVNGDYW